MALAGAGGLAASDMEGQYVSSNRRYLYGKRPKTTAWAEACVGLLTWVCLLVLDNGLFSSAFQIFFCRQTANKYCAALADSAMAVTYWSKLQNDEPHGWSGELPRPGFRAQSGPARAWKRRPCG